MVRHFSATILAAGLLCSAALALPAAAQYRYAQPFDPYDYYLDGPPDVIGCPKACARDFSPCDPPAFKRTDARCRNRSSR